VSGIDESERMSEGDFADMLADTVFNPNAAAEETPEPEANLESQVAEPVVEETVELPEPAFFEKKEVEVAGEEKPEETVVVEEEAEPEYAVWARKQFGDDLNLADPAIAKLAQSRYEAEKMIGKSQSELQEQRKLMEEEETRRRIERGGVRLGGACRRVGRPCRLRGRRP
jgi:hypothetical protein